MEAAPHDPTKYCELCQLTLTTRGGLRKHLQTTSHARVAAAFDRGAAECRELQELCAQQAQQIQQQQEALAVLQELLALRTSTRVPTAVGSAGAGGHAAQVNPQGPAISTGQPAPSSSPASLPAPSPAATGGLTCPDPATPAPLLEFRHATAEPDQAHASSAESEQVETLQQGPLDAGQDTDLPAQAAPSSCQVGQQATDSSEGPHRTSLGSVHNKQQPAGGQHQDQDHASGSAQDDTSICTQPQQTQDYLPPRSAPKAPASATGSGHRAPAPAGNTSGLTEFRCEDMRRWGSMEGSKMNNMLGLDRPSFEDILVTLFDYIHVNGEPSDRNIRNGSGGLECISCGVWTPTTVAIVIRETCNKFLIDVLPPDGILRSACQSHIEEAEQLLNVGSNHEVFEELGQRIYMVLDAGPRPGAVPLEPDSPPSGDTAPYFMEEDITGIYDFPGKLDRTRLVNLIACIWVRNPANRSIRWDPIAGRFSCIAGGQGEGLPGCKSLMEDLVCLLKEVASHIHSIKEAAVVKLQQVSASQAKVDKLEDTAELLSSYVDVCIDEVMSGQHDPALEVEPAIDAIKKLLLRNGQPVSRRGRRRT